jgi:hypothetical protein
VITLNGFHSIEIQGKSPCGLQKLNGLAMIGPFFAQKISFNGLFIKLNFFVYVNKANLLENSASFETDHSQTGPPKISVFT